MSAAEESEQVAGDPKLASKVTETTVREFDADGKLVAETITTVTARFKPEPDRVVGFSKPFKAAE